MQVVKLDIITDRSLVETLSDFLVGVLSAAVEYRVEEDGSQFTIHSFILSESNSPVEIEKLVTRVKEFGEEMATIFSIGPPRVTAELVKDIDWGSKWKEHFKPFRVSQKLVIAPSWEQYDSVEGEMVIVMDPGMAFGTGHHATTRLCLALMEEIQPLSDQRVLDVGTGTGVLAMAAALHGWREIVGIDNDSQAVIVARDNVLKNKLQNTVRITDTALSEMRGHFQLVIANIIHNVLMDMAEDLERVTATNGVLILSGLLYGKQTQNIIECFEKRCFSLITEVQEGEWGAIKFRKR